MVAMLCANQNGNVHLLAVQMRPILECPGQVVLIFHNLMIQPEHGASVVRGYINVGYYRTFIGLTEDDGRPEQLLTQILDASGISWRRGPVMSLAQRRKMVDREHPSLSIARQCVFL